MLPWSAWSQPDYPTTIDGMSADDLTQLIKSKLLFSDPVKQRRLMSESLAAKRFDLIRVFFENPGNIYDILNLVGRLPDDDFRQRVTVLALRVSTITLWTPEEDQIGSPIIGYGSHETEPFASIPKLLPGVTNLEARLKTKAERDKLAAEIEAALDAKSSQGRKEAPTVPLPMASASSGSPKYTQPAANPSSPSTSRATTPERSASVETAPQTETTSQSVLYVCIGAAILAALYWMHAVRKSHT